MPDIDLAAIVAEDAKQNTPAPGGSEPTQPVEVEDTAEATAAPGEAPEPSGDEPPKKGGKKPVGPRFAELTAQRREAIGRAEKAERLLELALKGQAPASAAPSGDKPKPQQSDFATYEAYNDAVIDWRAEKIADTKVKEVVARSQQDNAVQTFKQRVSAFHTEVAKEGKDIEGFEDAHAAVADESFPGTIVMAEYLMEADHKPQLVKWLGENPDEAERIAGLSDRAANKELARLDAQFGTKAAPRATKAPPPPPTVQGSGSSPQTLERMDYNAIKDWARKQSRG